LRRGAREEARGPAGAAAAGAGTGRLRRTERRRLGAARGNNRRCGGNVGPWARRFRPLATVAEGHLLARWWWRRAARCHLGRLDAAGGGLPPIPAPPPGGHQTRVPPPPPPP